jgi:GH24 family phage-related lysozyme (muramidase)
VTTPSIDLNLGTAAVLRIRASTRVRGAFTPLSPALSVDRLTHTWKLSGKADNLSREEPGKLTWLIQRSDGSIDRRPHPFDVVLVPGAKSGQLKEVTFDVKELAPPPGEPKDPPAAPQKRDPTWDVLRIGLFGQAQLGFHFDPARPSVDAFELAPADSNMTLAIPLQLEVLDATLAGPPDRASLRVGSKVAFRLTRGDMWARHRAQLRVWESETEPPPEHPAPACPGTACSWALDASEPHVETIRLGVDGAGLCYSLSDGAEPKLTMYYELNLRDGEDKEIAGATFAFRGKLGDLPAPTLSAWAIAPPLPAVEGAVVSASTPGGLRFPISGQIDNLAPDFPLTLQAALYTRVLDIDAKGKTVASFASLGDPIPLGAETAGQADQLPGRLAGKLRVPELDLAPLREHPKHGVFCALGFPSGTTNRNQPFAQVIRYEANMAGDGKDTGFAPFSDGVMALREDGLQVCTGLVDLEGHVAELDSDAKPKKHRMPPPAWFGDQRSPLTVGDMYADLSPLEGIVGHMYRDAAKEGNVTVGVGNLIPSLEAAQKLEFSNMDAMPVRKATADEIKVAWNAVMAKPPALPSSEYRHSPTIALSDTAIVDLFTKRFTNEFLPAAQHRFSGFDQFPKCARRGIVEMLYALGPTKFDAQFGLFIAAVKNGNWREAANQTLRGRQEHRNEWRRSLFEYAHRWTEEQAALAAGGTGSTAAP